MSTATQAGSPTTEPKPGTSTSPDAAAIWRAARGPLILAVLILLVVGLTVLLTSDRNQGALDPRSYAPSGSHALAQLLNDQGVDVIVATDTNSAIAAVEKAPDTTTVVVPFPERLTDDQLGAVATLRPARTVLIAPGNHALDAFGSDVHASGDTGVSRIDPLCDLPEAQRAGNADLGGTGYITNTPGATRCYPQDGTPSLILLPRDSGDLVLFGTGKPLRNTNLAQHGNASLTLQLLGAHPHVLWYLPTGVENGSDHKGLLSLLPAGWRFGSLQLGIAVVLFALYRARRLGPVVNEPLPVVVRASETAEGRARLYKRARTLDRAAEQLRAATRHRIATRLGLGTGDDAPTALVDATAARTGRSPAEVHDLLYGAVPANDDGLVTLADHLDHLEEHVKTGVREP
jgi:hypothetical protein